MEIIELTTTQRLTLSDCFDRPTSAPVKLRLSEFYRYPGRNPQESVQIAINDLWLYRDGTWHAQPEPPVPRFLVRFGPDSYFEAYANGGIRWTISPEDASWFTTKDRAQDFIDSDQGLYDVATIEEYCG